MVTRRQIISIDEERCDGCGLCALACAEGAIQVIEGKARLISEQYCDGLGACIGECPQGAIAIEQRDAEKFNAEAVEHHLAAAAASSHGTGPGATAEDESKAKPSALNNWPVQIRLVPVVAPYFQGASLLIAADCVPFAFADFHSRLLADRTLMVGCPKLDDAELYARKLCQLFSHNDIQSVDIAYMEVPCCFGLVRIVREALEESGKSIPVRLAKIGIGGNICETSDLAAHPA